MIFEKLTDKAKANIIDIIEFIDDFINKIS